MKPYKLIKGTTKNLSDFEDNVSTALEEGYDFGGDLLTQTVGNSGDSSDVLLLQPMVLEEEIEFDAEDFEDLEGEVI